MTNMNAQRAGWALAAIRAFSDEVNSDNTSEAVGDLLCDIGHFCDLAKLDYLQVVAHAIGVWHAERRDPVGLAPEPDVLVIVDGKGVCA